MVSAFPDGLSFTNFETNRPETIIPAGALAVSLPVARPDHWNLATGRMRAEARDATELGVPFGRGNGSDWPAGATLAERS
ncbi:MAG: hypothetical protein ABGW87_01780 [Sphingomonadaceae bacterium]